MEEISFKTELTSALRIQTAQKQALKRLGIITVRDLFYYFPSRYSTTSKISNVPQAMEGEQVTIFGILSDIKKRKAFRSKIPMSEAKLTDLTGKSMNIIWFRQAFIANLLEEGQKVKITGKVSSGKYGLSLINPEYEKVSSIEEATKDSLFQENGNEESVFGYPVYRETRGLSSKWVYHSISKLIKTGVLENEKDPLPKTLIKKYNLPDLKTAMIWLHRPKRQEDAESAQKRFAFEEILLIQLQNQKHRQVYEKHFSYKVELNRKKIKDFINRFPFKPTKSQNKALESIFEDISTDKPMLRLVEGDVGSGKTFVAAVTSYVVASQRPKNEDGKQNFGNLQIAYMAPTEVLAKQLFENFIQYFEGTGMQIGLITGKECRKFPSKVNSEKWTQISRAQILKWIKNGEIPIVIGTHALIQKSVEFKDLALAIIDEQHRFGTNQRMHLTKKDARAPHYLSMTATPIPRTLTLTIYGDLDLTIIDEMPSGRKKVITEIVQEKNREGAYDKIKKELKKGRQVYVICPRIDEPDPNKETALNVKAAKTEAKRLKENVFQDYSIDVMHSKLKKDEKEKGMNKFINKETDILVSTSVIEVGVSVENATTIIIEGAERFGLAQIHQLRGRVQRSNHQSYCYLFADAKTDKTIERLKAVEKTTSGFVLAEMDLKLRGGGDLSGQKQWGLTDLAMQAIKNMKLVEAARKEAKEILKKNPGLKKYPKLREIIEKQDTIHFE